MISRISSITCSHAPAIPADEGRIYSRIGEVARPCVGIGAVKDAYSAFVKDRFENYKVESHRPEHGKQLQRSTNDWISTLSLALAAVFQRQQRTEHPAGFAREPSHLLIIRA